MRSVSLFANRIVELVLIGLSVAMFVADDVLFLVLWNLVAMLYLATRVRRVRRARRGRQGDWLARLLPQRLGFLFTLLIAITGVSAGLTIVIGDELGSEVYGDELAAQIARAVAVPAVLLAWGILNFGYAERYAQSYFAALPQRILEFPEQQQPTFVEFVYFSFTIGVSFAVSDVETRGTAIRSRVLAHSVLSFVYNTATLGIAVGVITGK